MKRGCNKLIIIKNKIKIDEYNLLTYIFQWLMDNDILVEEIRKIDRDEFGNPIENYTIEELLEMKKQCCLEIDLSTFIIEEKITNE